MSLSFTLKKKITSESYQLGVRSNIPKDFCIRGSSFDNIIYTFTLLPSVKSNVSYSIPPTQHIYFATSLESLASAKFEIINLATNQLFTEIDGSQDPTFIEIAVKSKKMTTVPVLLQSEDEVSKSIYSNNHNMNFTSTLPMRLELQGETWSVITKGVQLTGALFNIQDQTFNVEYTQYFTEKTNIVEDGQTLNQQVINYQQYFHYDGDNDMIDMDTVKIREFTLPDRFYSSRQNIITEINTGLTNQGIEVQFEIQGGKTILQSTFIFDDEKYLKHRSSAILSISSELAEILGYESTDFDVLNNRSWISPNGLNISKVDTNSVKQLKIIVPPGFYQKKKEIVDYLNTQLQQNKIPTQFLNLTPGTKIVSSFRMNSNRYDQDQSKASLKISPRLAIMLGFTIENQELEMNLLTTSNLTSSYEENLNIGLPTNLLVHMDIVQSRVVGRHQFPVIQMLNIGRQHMKQKILHFVVRENNIALLVTKLFSEIKIKITDIEGKEILARNDYPTIIHLNFVKWDE